MANALAELFGNIATAIKAKTGDGSEVKYKPIDFPEKIESISTGGAWSAKYTDGSFEPTDSIMTVSHGLGVVPDIIACYLSSGNAQTRTTLVAAYGVSSKFKDLTTSGYPTGTVMSEAAALSDARCTIDSNRSNAITYGMIRNTNSSTFTIGGTTYNTLDITPADSDPNDDVYPSTVFYNWFAFAFE